MLFFENVLLPLMEVVVPLSIFMYSLSSRKKEGKRLWPVFVFLALSLPIAYGLGGIRVVPTGNWGVETQFGEVLTRAETHPAGPTWIYPWRQIHLLSSRQQQVHPHLAQGKDLEVVAKDGLLLVVDADLSMLVNKAYAPEVHSAYGSIEEVVAHLMIPAAHTAVKNSGADMEGKAAWETDRFAFQTKIHDNFVDTVIQQIAVLPEFSDFSRNELDAVFTFPPAMLGPTLPPAIVTEQVAQLRAADEAQKTQSSLTQVALARQETAKAEAQIVADYVEALPEGVTLEEIAVWENSRSFAAIAKDTTRKIGEVTVIVGQPAGRTLDRSGATVSD